MSNLLPYLLKLSISLCVIYVFYQVFLRRLTFYNWNRWYLLSYSMVCFIMPFVNVFTFVTEPDPQEASLIHLIPSIDNMAIPEPEAAATDWKTVAIIIVLIGIVLLGIRLLIQYLSLVKMRTHAKLLYDSNVKLYHIDKPVIPFSFGNAIYINQHQHTQEELADIMRHEFIHVKERHTVDMMWSEVLCILNWYNPFAWLLKRSIRQNLEFIADNQVLKTGFDRKQYQYLLLKVIGSPAFSIASNFNFSSLKKRIAMMNKAKSARVNLLRFLFILPLLAVILLAFRNIKQEQKNEWTVQAETLPVIEVVSSAMETPSVDTVPQKVVITPGVKKEKVKPEDIESIHVFKQDGQNTITITLKNGDVDLFDLEKEESRKKYTEKYGGELPKAATPPDPLKEIIVEGRAAPTAPGALNEVVVEGYGVPKPAPAPAPPIYDCFNDKGYCITVADNNGECVVIVKNKDKKIVEAVALTEWDNNEKFKKKYGEIVVPVKPVAPRKPAQPAQPGKPRAVSQAKPVTFRAKPVDEVALTSGGVTFAATATPSQKPHSVKSDPMIPEWSVVINKNSTPQQLEVVKQILASHGHFMEIKESSYKDDLLTVFKALITSQDGGKGTIKTEDLRKGQVIISGGKNSQGKETYSVYIKADETVL